MRKNDGTHPRSILVRGSGKAEEDRVLIAKKGVARVARLFEIMFVATRYVGESIGGNKIRAKLPDTITCNALF